MGKRDEGGKMKVDYGGVGERPRACEPRWQKVGKGRDEARDTAEKARVRW